ncbi:hypothetical protein NPIL_703311 [Nephila pilipes]|uniref:Uncharacterized protein n=1 Tax=Nephila pilipes TaxID=299642 RepID=A0A8X6PSE2_NEPPI|nr:hypothetical protein NPIL_703311 [Nephila pilipes]
MKTREAYNLVSAELKGIEKVQEVDSQWHPKEPRLSVVFEEWRLPTSDALLSLDYYFPMHFPMHTQCSINYLNRKDNNVKNNRAGYLVKRKCTYLFAFNRTVEGLHSHRVPEHKVGIVKERTIDLKGRPWRRRTMTSPPAPGLYRPPSIRKIPKNCTICRWSGLYMTTKSGQQQLNFGGAHFVNNRRKASDNWRDFLAGSAIKGMLNTDLHVEGSNRPCHLRVTDLIHQGVETFPQRKAEMHGTSEHHLNANTCL